MKYILTLSLVALASIVFAQMKRDTALAARIKEMYKADQKWRKGYFKLKGSHNQYDEETILANEARADSLNLIEAKMIVKQYGYPGFDLVGEDGSSRFWAIIQHCDDDVSFQEKVLRLMHEQVRRKNASGENYAYLEDRVLIGTHHKQIYGTQLRLDPVTRKSSPLPLDDPAHVDERRRAVGMGTLADYIKMNDAYH